MRLLCLLLCAFAVQHGAPVQAQPADAAMAEALEQQGNQLSKAGQHAPAIDAWRRSLAIRTALGDRPGQARITGTMGIEYFEHSEYAAAIAALQQFLPLTQQIGNRRAEGIAYTYLGNANVYINHYADASQHLRRALDFVREFHDLPGEGVVLSGLGTSDFHLGHYADAQRSFERLLELGRSLHDAQLTTFAELGLANVADALGDSKRAQELYQHTLESARAAGDRRAEGRALGGLGNVQLGAANYDAARDSYQRSLALARELRDREGEGNALGNLANLYALSGRRDAARKAAQESLQIARERQDRQGEADALNAQGLAAERFGDAAQAIAAYQRANEQARLSGNRSGAMVAMTNLGGALLTAGRVGEAERALREAVQIADALRDDDLSDANRVRYFETQLVAYRQIRDVLLAQRKDAEALEFAERGRAQALRVLLARRLAVSEGARLRFAAPLRYREISQLAQQRHFTLVEYAVDDKAGKLLAWVVKPDGSTQLRRTAIDGPLATLVRDARAAIGASGIDDSARSRGLRVVADEKRAFTPQLQQLDRLLIEPIADLLPADPADPVVFIPDRELFLVPFAALLASDGRFLIERHTVLSAPSIDVLRLAQDRSVQTRAVESTSALVVGNPLMPQIAAGADGAMVTLPPLPGAEKEAKSVAKLLGTSALIGRQATKQRVERQMAGARIVHLATHGTLDDFGTGMPGTIALAPDANDSGLLTSMEIAALSIRAELVVLSACDTGRGRLTGDGVVGLSRALLSAGASSVMVSLWAVPDEPTAALMIAFYEQLRGGTREAAALRSAMLQVKQRYPDPGNWAAFVLVGQSQ